MRYLSPALLLVGFAIFMLISTSAAGYTGMGSEHFNIAISTFGDGGNRMSSAQYVMIGTVGQINNLSAQSSNFMISAGYWPCEVVVSLKRVFLPIMSRS
jgi:hypothetical protein